MHSSNITEDDIAELVEEFYRRVRADLVLGPFFQNNISDWEHHLQTMKHFWSSVALTSGKYKGHPMQVHLALAGLQDDHFTMWLSHFESAAGDLFDAQKAEHFVSRARRIAESFKLGLSFYRKEPIFIQVRKDHHHAR